jgi:hypothetical protein
MHRSDARFPPSGRIYYAEEMSRFLPKSLPVALIAIFAAAASRSASASPPIDYDRDIRPILSDRCYVCHGPDNETRQADLRLDTADGLHAAGVIDTADADASELLRRVTSDDPELVMPPPESKLPPISTGEADKLRTWIAEGGTVAGHWSFEPLPDRVPVPTTTHSFVTDPIDALVAHSWESDGVQPAAAAARSRWLRRVSIDLTGLPPTADQVRRFLADNRPQAAAIVVDRLLASPAYGEHMARTWLDLSRYADTFGYQSDRLMHVWPWRNWVIDAYNANMPFDQFLTWQVAGDLVDTPNDQSRLATAFNRLHRQTNEGGSIEEEFRVEYIADRAQTLGTAVLGLTVGCARCHDHKYDPILQKEFYQLSAFFANIDESGLYSHFTETAPTPAMPLYGAGQAQQHATLIANIQQHEQEVASIEQSLQAKPHDTLASTSPPPMHAWDFDDPSLPVGFNTHVEGKRGRAIQFNGDDEFPPGDNTQWSRTQPFTIALWLKSNQHAPRTMVLHRSRAAEDAAFRGMQLVLEDGKVDLGLIHFWPGNAVRIRATQPIAAQQWTHIAVTYDGSSRASGMKIYVDGQKQAVEVIRDQLSRDIVYRGVWGDSDEASIQLALGARFRDVGLKDGAIDELKIWDQVLSPVEIASIAETSIAGTSVAETSVATTSVLDDQSGWADHVRLRLPDAALDDARRRLRAAREEENAMIMQVPQIMVMADLPNDRARPTHNLNRGAYDAPREVVEPATPTWLPPMDASSPRNRLGLARWLCDPKHPLVARVAVNRVWETFFGRGLVETPEDFGSQGARPTHPQLLDYLARRLIDSGWDTKSLCRQIALSSVYCQDSQPSQPELLQSDPLNQRLARGPSHRLNAEEVRDLALAASGLLVRRLGGPSVYPYQPAGLWSESGGSGGDYVSDQGAGLFRRSMYTFWKRTIPPPNMLAFDAVSRESCVARRERTNTPLQALILLNDPQFVEAARILAQQVIELPDAQRMEQIALQLIGRTLDERESSIVQGLLDDQRSAFASSRPACDALLTVGTIPVPPFADRVELAATTVIVQAIMNLDACVVKR